MPTTTKNGGFRHFQYFCHRISRNKKLLFEQVFSDSLPNEVLDSLKIKYRCRIFTPLVTLWAFMNQVLDLDHSCRAAVSSLIGLQGALNLKVVSSATGAYCRARIRLPLNFILEWTKRSGRRLADHVPERWLWKGFHVFLVDGTVLSVPDSKANQKVFTRPSNSHGLLRSRVVGIFSLTCGSLIDASIAAWSGKGTGEGALFKRIRNSIKQGELVLMDKLYADYNTLKYLSQRGIEFVVRRPDNQKTMSEKRGHRFQKYDFLKTIYIRSNKETLEVRIVRVTVRSKGFRAKTLELMTSLTDEKRYRAEEIAELYRKRWNVEIDFNALKTALNMDRLRCQTPAMIEKEIWVHLLVYNMIRTIMAEAAIKKEILPRELSFKETLQLIKQFRLIIVIQSSKDQERLYEILIDSMKDRVGNRPGRIEPRLLKHSGRKYDLLKVPRSKARKLFTLKGRHGQTRREEKRKIK